jgi:hypothetical protein
MGGPGAT